MRCRFSPGALPLESTPVDNLFILEFLPAADGTQLRVYLYGLMLCRYPAFDNNTLPEVLGLSEEETLQAFAYWQREGLVRIICANPLEVEYVAPAERGRGPALHHGKYGQLLQAAQSLFAPRTLRTNELRRMYDWVDVFGLEEDAVLELIAHCIALKGNRVSMQYIDTVARTWADAGVRTADDAKEHATAFEEMTSGAMQILTRWRKTRRPTQDELQLYEKWTGAWGFTPNAILAACPAVTKAERPSFAYLDGVLEQLRQQGVSTETQVGEQLEMADKSTALAREVFARMGAGRAARPQERAQLLEFMNAGLQKEALLFAAEQAASKEQPVGFLKKLLSNYIESGIRTREEAEKHAAEHAELQSFSRKEKKPSAMDYPQARYSDDELKHIFINLDESGEA